MVLRGQRQEGSRCFVSSFKSDDASSVVSDLDADDDQIMEDLEAKLGLSLTATPLWLCSLYELI